MTTDTVVSDKGIGFAMLFSFLAAGGAVAMFAGAPEQTAAWGFAAAMLFASLAIAYIHLYW
ncbi:MULTISPECIES: hypothetical protein [Halostella]|uniref:DUF7525 family protein n=1 Tax=Halostella TaxID=1843185 RepID=UPI0010813E10|nr:MULTISPECIES: hypothetical protein [Halostella]